MVQMLKRRHFLGLALVVLLVSGISFLWASVAGQAAVTPAQITVSVEWVPAGDITLADVVILTFECTPGEHSQGEGKGHEEHGQGEGKGHGEECPSELLGVTVTANDIDGNEVGSAVADVTVVPGSAEFDFEPDILIEPVESVTVTLSEL